MAYLVYIKQNLLDSCATGAKLSYLGGKIQFWALDITLTPTSLWILIDSSQASQGE